MSLHNHIFAPRRKFLSLAPRGERSPGYQKQWPTLHETQCPNNCATPWDFPETTFYDKTSKPLPYNFKYTTEEDPKVKFILFIMVSMLISTMRQRIQLYGLKENHNNSATFLALLDTLLCKVSLREKDWSHYNGS